MCVYIHAHTQNGKCAEIPPFFISAYHKVISESQRGILKSELGSVSLVSYILLWCRVCDSTEKLYLQRAALV